MDLGGLDFDEQVRDLPLPFLRMLDLARALAFDPQLLVLDEITAALPPDLSERVFAVMQRWKERNRSVLFISHRLAEVRTHCDMCTVLRDGRNVASFVPGEGGEAQIVSAMLGEAATVVRDEARTRTTAVATDQRPIFEADHVGAGRQLEEVSLAVAPGEVLGLVALEGQGQETLFDILAGNLKPDRGQLLIDGEPVKAHHPFDVIRRGIVLVPADRLHALLPQRSIRENIAAPLFNRVGKWGPINGREERRRVQESVNRLSIDTRAASQVRRLSGGNQQKVTIARWLARGLRVMLLFDPTRGIDVGTKHQVYDLIRALADEGQAIIMFTSELREVGLVCDRSAVLHNGRIVAEMPADAGENDAAVGSAWPGGGRRHDGRGHHAGLVRRRGHQAAGAVEHASPASPAARDGPSASPCCWSCCCCGASRNFPISVASRSGRSPPARCRSPSSRWPRASSSSPAASTSRWGR